LLAKDLRGGGCKECREGQRRTRKQPGEGPIEVT